MRESAPRIKCILLETFPNNRETRGTFLWNAGTAMMQQRFGAARPLPDQVMTRGILNFSFSRAFSEERILRRFRSLGFS